MGKSGSPWKPSEVAFVRRNYKKLTTKEIAEKLGRPYGGVAWKINDLDLPNEPTYKALQNAQQHRRSGTATGKKVPIVSTTSGVPRVQTSTSAVKAKPAKKPWWKFWA